MLKTKAVQFYMEGDNCSQCMVKAAASEYGIDLSGQVMDMLQGMNNGLGAGCLCCLLDAGIMSFGLLFDAAAAKRLRIRLLYTFHERYGDLNCPSVKCKGENLIDCQSVIGETADMIQNLIDDELALSARFA